MAPVVRLKDVNIVKFQDILGLQKAKWISKLVNALDSKLFGIIPAVIEPALEKWRAKAEAFKVREVSRAHTDADSYRATEIAKAQAFALITVSKAKRAATEALSAHSTPNLYDRTVERIRSLELDHQQNLEKTVSLAVQRLLDEPSKPESEETDQPIGEEWIARWIDAAKWASASNVRDIWARMLSGKSMASERGISLQLIETLRLVDEAMARFFNDHAAEMYFARFVGVPVRMKEEPSAVVARQAARRLALAGLSSDLKQGAYNIFFQSCIFRIEFRTLRFDSAYRFTALGNELFEALHSNAAELRDACRQLTSGQVRTQSDQLTTNAEEVLQKLRRYVPDAQFEHLGEFVRAQIAGRSITRLAVLRFFPALLPGSEWIEIDENEYSNSWEAMYHEAGHIRTHPWLRKIWNQRELSGNASRANN